MKQISDKWEINVFSFFVSYKNIHLSRYTTDAVKYEKLGDPPPIVLCIVTPHLTSTIN